MQTKFKTVFLTVSLIINFIFILLFVIAAQSNTSHISFFSPGNGNVTAAAVVSFPADGSASFDVIEINMKPLGKAFLQFSFMFNKQQGNLLVNALYDHEVISVTQTGFGIEITALAAGSTLMQTLTNEGIKNIAFITVE